MKKHYLDYWFKAQSYYGDWKNPTTAKKRLKENDWNIDRYNYAYSYLNDKKLSRFETGTYIIIASLRRSLINTRNF